MVHSFHAQARATCEPAQLEIIIIIMSMCDVVAAGVKLVSIASQAWPIPGFRHADPHFHALTSEIAAFSKVLEGLQQHSPELSSREKKIQHNLDAELTKTRNHLQSRDNEVRRLKAVLAASEVKHTDLNEQLANKAKEVHAMQEEFETRIGEAKDNLAVNDSELHRVYGLLEAKNAELAALAAQSNLRCRALIAAHGDMELKDLAHAKDMGRLRELLRQARAEMLQAGCDQLRRACDREIGDCVICFSSTSNMAFACGHLAVCESCSSSKTFQECPVCRHPGGPDLRIYFV